MRLGFAVLISMLCFAGSADARTVRQDLAAAQAYWDSDVCAGKWQVLPDDSLRERSHHGEAIGIAFQHNPVSGTFAADGTRWDWFIASCTFSMDPALQGCDREHTVRHEVGHFIHGPGHTGPMSPAVLNKAPCTINPRSAKRKRARRCARRKGGARRAFIRRSHRRGVSSCASRSARRGRSSAARRRSGVR